MQLQLLAHFTASFLSYKNLFGWIHPMGCHRYFTLPCYHSDKLVGSLSCYINDHILMHHRRVGFLLHQWLISLCITSVLMTQELFGNDWSLRTKKSPRLKKLILKRKKMDLVKQVLNHKNHTKGLVRRKWVKNERNLHVEMVLN